jgi:hypothetical protein
MVVSPSKNKCFYMRVNMNSDLWFSDVLHMNSGRNRNHPKKCGINRTLKDLEMGIPVTQ